MLFKSLELHSRSIVKAITYRLVNITIDSLVVYFFTRSVPLSLSLVLLINGYSTFIYYFHERVWAHIHWGRRPAAANGVPPAR